MLTIVTVSFSEAFDTDSTDASAATPVPSAVDSGYSFLGSYHDGTNASSPTSLYESVYASQEYFDGETFYVNTGSYVQLDFNPYGIMDIEVPRGSGLNSMLSGNLNAGTWVVEAVDAESETVFKCTFVVIDAVHKEMVTLEVFPDLKEIQVEATYTMPGMYDEYHLEYTLPDISYTVDDGEYTYQFITWVNTRTLYESPGGTVSGYMSEGILDWCGCWGAYPELTIHASATNVPEPSDFVWGCDSIDLWISVPDVTPEMAGYEFVGWEISDDTWSAENGGFIAAPGESFQTIRMVETVYGPVELTAVWESTYPALMFESDPVTDGILIPPDHHIVYFMDTLGTEVLKYEIVRHGECVQYWDPDPSDRLDAWTSYDAHAGTSISKKYEYDFDQPVLSDLVLYNVWVELDNGSGGGAGQD